MRGNQGKGHEKPMATHQWTDSWSVGSDLLDDDHSTILTLIREIEALSGNRDASRQVGSIVAAVAAYTDVHFRREEAVMEAAGYPDLPNHRDLHESLKARTNQFLRVALETPNQIEIDVLHHFLKTWWESHILQVDMAYRPYLEQNPEAENAGKLDG